MFSFSFFVDIFFRILNFAILILVLRYIFKNYVIETIKKAMRDRHAYVRGLEEHLRAVSYQRDILMMTLDHEHIAGAQIEKKIVRWAEVMVAERKNRIREKDAIMRKVTAHAVEREDALKVLHAQHLVAAEILNSVERSLKEELVDTKLSGMVVRRIVQSMKAKNHD